MRWRSCSKKKASRTERQTAGVSHASAAPSPTRGVAAGLLSREITGEVSGLRVLALLAFDPLEHQGLVILDVLAQ
jgi:hypothetical protein